MKPTSAWIDGIKGGKVCTYEWVKRKPKAVVIILHGMAEHALRYERFATTLVENNYAVFSMDLRGHGASAQRGIRGFFNHDQGDICVLSDVQHLVMRALDVYGNVPVILFGQGMGAIIAENAIQRFGELFRGAVLSGVTLGETPKRFFDPIITQFLGAFEKDRQPSPSLTKAAFGAYNKPFEPARTAFDWLTTDAEEVDKYIADNKCGADMTPNVFNCVAKMLNYKLGHAKKIPDTMGVHVIAGSEDPMGGKAAVEAVAKMYSAKSSKVTSKVYEGARHELLNETCRDEVTADILAAIDGMLK